MRVEEEPPQVQGFTSSRNSVRLLQLRPSFPCQAANIGAGRGVGEQTERSNTSQTGSKTKILSKGHRNTQRKVEREGQRGKE
jgi:hypothetical protein